MGNRSTVAQRSAAGSEATDTKKTNSSNVTTSSDGASTDNVSNLEESGTESVSNAVEESIRLQLKMEQLRKDVAEHNAATLKMEYSRFEEEWDSDFSTVSRSEMTTTDQSKLPSPQTNQSTPFRVPLKKSQSGSERQTSGSGAPESSAPPTSSLSSSDTWYGLPSLIETEQRAELEAFAKPSPLDLKWVEQAHEYFDNEKVFARKPTKPTVGRRLRIGRRQKRRWSTIVREMALRHPLPINPAPFPLSKAMDELKLRPEKRFTMPHN